MLTIASIIKLVLSIGFTIQVESINSLDYAVKYYNQENNTFYACNIVETDIGKSSICQTSANTAIIYVLTKE